MGSTIGERIAQIIEAKKLKRVQFADELCIDQSYVTQLTTGRRNPSNRLLMSICEKYNVNETWLRTGEGEMFRPMDRREEMARFWEEVSGAPLDDIRVRLVDVLSRLTREDWAFIERRARELVAEVRAANGDVSDSDTKIAAPAEAGTAVTKGPVAEAEALYEKSLGIAPRGASSASNTTGGKKDEGASRTAG